MNTELRELILKLIEKNSRLAIHDLAVMLDVAETEVANEIAEYGKRTYHLWVSYFDQLGQYKQGSTDSDDRGKSNTTKRSGIRPHCRTYL